MFGISPRVLYLSKKVTETLASNQHPPQSGSSSNSTNLLSDGRYYGSRNKKTGNDSHDKHMRTSHCVLNLIRLQL